MEEIPKEEEKISRKRARRIAEKIDRARHSIVISRAWWSSFYVEFIFLVALVVYNIYIIRPLLVISANVPFFSGPVIPLLGKFLGFWGVDMFFAIQIINVASFVLFPVSFYFFVKKISKRKLITIFALSFASLPVYPFAEPRILNAFIGVDSAHLVALVFVPIALIGVYNFVHEGGPSNLILATILSSLVALTSPFAFMNFIIFSVILSFSEMLLGNGRIKIIRFLVLTLFSTGLVSFWYNPAFWYWLLIGPLGTEIRRMLFKIIPISFFTVPILGTFGYLLFDRKPNLQHLFVSSFLTLSFFLISVAGGGIFPSHPSRYVPEFGISFSFLLGVILVGGGEYLISRSNITKRVPLLNLAKREVVFSILLLSLLFLLMLTGGVSRKSLLKKTKVLGVFEGIEKGSVWRGREKFGGAFSFLGYGISLGSAGALGYFLKKSKQR